MFSVTLWWLSLSHLTLFIGGIRVIIMSTGRVLVSSKLNTVFLELYLIVSVIYSWCQLTMARSDINGLRYPLGLPYQFEGHSKTWYTVYIAWTISLTKTIFWLTIHEPVSPHPAMTPVCLYPAVCNSAWLGNPCSRCVRGKQIGLACRYMIHHYLMRWIYQEPINCISATCLKRLTYTSARYHIYPYRKIIHLILAQSR